LAVFWRCHSKIAFTEVQNGAETRIVHNKQTYGCLLPLVSALSIYFKDKAIHYLFFITFFCTRFYCE
jgi:hypothetical protein